MPDPDNFQIKEEDIKNFESCADFVNGNSFKSSVVQLSWPVSLMRNNVRVAMKLGNFEVR
jgi:hypothetical protein